jgi:hypothetical protein
MFEVTRKSHQVPDRQYPGYASQNTYTTLRKRGVGDFRPPSEIIRLREKLFV